MILTLLFIVNLEWLKYNLGYMDVAAGSNEEQLTKKL